MKYRAAYEAGKKAFALCVSFSTYEHSPKREVRDAYNRGYSDAKRERGQ